MLLDTTYRDRLQAVERDVRAGLGLYGYQGTNHITDGDFGDYLTKQQIPYEERAIPTVGTWEDVARELRYHHPEHGARYAYLITHRVDIDSWAQDAYVFTEPVPNDRLHEVIKLIDAQEQDLNALVEERRREIDAEYLPFCCARTDGPPRSRAMSGDGERTASAARTGRDSRTRSSARSSPMAN